MGCQIEGFVAGVGGRRSGAGFRHAETELSFRQWRENAEELGIGVQSLGMRLSLRYEFGRWLMTEVMSSLEHG